MNYDPGIRVSGIKNQDTGYSILTWYIFISLRFNTFFIFVISRRVIGELSN